MNFENNTFELDLKSNKKSFDWGVLTDQNPTKFAKQLIKNGIDISVVKEHLMRDFFVSESKANLVYQVLRSQKTIIRNDNLINLQIHFPTCLKQDETEKYLTALKQEISKVKNIIIQKSYVLRSLYISGDILNVLNEKKLNEFLSEISYLVTEYTVETNIVEAITEEKLLILKKHGVTTLVLNPQTFVVKTLKTLGLKHNNNQVFQAYMLALKNNFLVSFNFVAGLENETLTNFKKTISLALELSPHNIEIKSANLIKQNLQQESQVCKMVDYAYKTLTKSGYRPYYLQREKSDLNYIENIGYAIDGKVSLFDIDTTEETISVISCGIGAISKKIVSSEKEVKVQKNQALLSEYIENIDNILNEKEKLF